MRGRRGSVGAGAILALVSALALLDRAGVVDAQVEPAPITIRLEPPPPMIVGARAEVIAHVRLAADRHRHACERRALAAWEEEHRQERKIARERLQA